MNDETKTMTLEFGEHFSLTDDNNENSLFKGLNIYVRNNGSRLVKVTTDGESILISVEKYEKKL